MAGRAYHSRHFRRWEVIQRMQMTAENEIESCLVDEVLNGLHILKVT